MNQVLHVGCGAHSPEKLHDAFRSPEWQEIRLDIDPDVAPDIVASITDMSPVRGALAPWQSRHAHIGSVRVPGSLRKGSR